MNEGYTFYDILLSLAEHPAHIIGFGESDMLRFDLDKKDIVATNGKYLMADGELQVDKISFIDGREFDLSNVRLVSKRNKPIPLEEIEHLWYMYYNSVPNERCQRNRCNFKARHDTEMNFMEMFGASRTYAQYALEAFILLNSLENTFIWESEKNFFWQSQRYPKLIIYRDWIKGGNYVRTGTSD